MTMRAGKLRLALYIGWYRWCDWRHDTPEDPDATEELLEAIRDSGHTVCALILRRGDRLERWARRLKAPLLWLPAALHRPFSTMRRTLTEEAWRRDRTLRRWLAAFRATAPDLGLVYLGGWVPPQVAATPRLGFVNYHPAPLPELPGFFPELFLALWGRTRARGTVHRVAEEFDRGEILAYTPAVRLPRLTTPKDVGMRLLRGGIGTILATADRLAAGTLSPAAPATARPFPVTLTAVNRESRLRWDEDDHATLLARLRCFGSSPWEFCQPLHADLGGRERQVVDLEVYGGTFHGCPGERVGTYRGPGFFAGAALVRTREGVAVVRAGPPFRPEQKLRRAREWLVPPGRRARRTSRKGFALD